MEETDQEYTRRITEEEEMRQAATFAREQYLDQKDNEVRQARHGHGRVEVSPGAQSHTRGGGGSGDY